MKNKQVMNHQTSSKELHLISCGYEKCSADSSYGPTVRRYYILHFVLSGQGHFFVNNKHYIVCENQYFLITPDVLTYYGADAKDPWTYVWICFNGDSVPAILTHCHVGLESPVQNFCHTSQIKKLIFDMMEYPNLTPANECHIQSYLYAIMAELCESANASYSVSESNDNFYITQATSYILGNSGVEISVMDVADYLHISRSYLYALFKKHLNVSPQQFLTMSRITTARELLANTDIPISTISSSCGYQNPFAFSRAFKKESGMAPSDYRAKYRHLEEIIDY